jgi:NodT family efflux transporter outer membrane factor (OMF) lipoprotein
MTMNRALPLIALLLAGCSVGPHYAVPATPAPAAFKEAGVASVFRPAVPADAADRGDWWRMFDDPELDRLETAAGAANQTVAAAAANYAQALAVMRESRSALFPTATAGGGYTRSKQGATSNLANDLTSRPGDTVNVNVAASWTPDLFGAIRGAVHGEEAAAAASAGDLANARLAVAGEVASNYLQLRALDAQKALLDQTVAAYDRDFTITRNRYAAGVVAKSDVLQAQTQLLNAKTTAVDIVRQRGIVEHALAVLVGSAPAEFSIAPQPNWQPSMPVVPVSLPSDLLQRRPDIAAAERRVAAANAQIGVETAAWFPSLTLSASAGQTASSFSPLFSTPANVWSLGLQLAETLFDGGLRHARIAAARAGYGATVADYRQTVLTAFQQIEDNLLADCTLAEEVDLAQQSATAANGAEAIARNQYKAGQTDFTAVVVAQTAALSANRAAIQTQMLRQAAIVALIQAFGGGWTNPAPA